MMIFFFLNLVFFSYTFRIRKFTEVWWSTLSICLIFIFSSSQLIEISEIGVLDQVSTPMMGLSTFLLLVCLSFISLNSFQNWSSSIILAFSSMILFFIVKKFLLFFILFEISLIPVFFLVVSWGSQPERLRAGTFMIMYTLIGSFPLLLTILSFPGWKSGVNFSSMLFDEFTSLYSESGVFVVVVLLAFLVKTPLFLFHSWLPKAHVEATIVGSVILAGVMLKMGVYGVIRFLPYLNPDSVFIYSIFSVSIIGALISSWLSISSDDMKMSVAYASVSHMNLCLGSLLTYKSLASKACVMVLLTHGLSSSGLFFLVTLIYTMSGSRSLMVSKGVLSVVPAIQLAGFFLWALNLAAPPSLSFSSEIWTLASITSSMEVILPILCVFILFNSFFSFFNFGLLSSESSKGLYKDLPSSKWFFPLFSVSVPVIVMFFFLDLLSW